MVLRLTLRIDALASRNKLRPKKGKKVLVMIKLIPQAYARALDAFGCDAYTADDGHTASSGAPSTIIFRKVLGACFLRLFNVHNWQNLQIIY